MADEPRRWKFRRREAFRPSLSAATMVTIGTPSERAMSFRPLTMKVTFSVSVGGSGSCGTLRGPAAHDLLAHVLDLDGARLVRQVGQRRLHGDEPVEQVLLLVLEAEVEDVGLAARGDVAGHLQGHRRVARALRATDQQQLAGTEAAAHGLVEARGAEGARS